MIKGLWLVVDMGMKEVDVSTPRSNGRQSHMFN